jgi:hypothetical protein
MCRYSKKRGIRKVLRPGFEPGFPTVFHFWVERPEYLAGLYYRSLAFVYHLD